MRFACLLLAGCLSFSQFKSDGTDAELMGLPGSTAVQAAGPLNVVAVAGNGSVTLTWDEVSDAAEYTLYVCTQDPFDFDAALRLSPVRSPFTHDNLENGVTYIYRVTARLAQGESAPSDEARATPLARLPPGAPTLHALAGNTQVTLTWEAQPGLTYRLQFSVGGTLTDPTEIVDVTSPFVHAGRANETTYAYALIATNEYGDSPPSAVVTATPLPPPPNPPNLNWDNAGGTEFHPHMRMVFSVMTPVAGATSHKLYWQTTPGIVRGTANVVTLNTGGGATFVLLPACADVYFASSSIGAGGEGALGAESSLKACPGGCARPAGAEDAFWFDPTNGDDLSFDGKCFPFRTLTHALDGRAPGDVVALLRQALYTTNATVVVPAGVTLVGQNDTQTGTEIDASGSAASGVWLGAGAALKNLSVDGPAGEYAVSVGGDDVLIENVQLRDGGSGLVTASANTHLKYMKIHGFGTGVEVYDADGFVMENSFVYANSRGMLIAPSDYGMTASLTSTILGPNYVSCNSAVNIELNATDDPFEPGGGALQVNNVGLVMSHFPATSQYADQAGVCEGGGADVCFNYSPSLDEDMFFTLTNVRTTPATCPLEFE